MRTEAFDGTKSQLKSPEVIELTSSKQSFAMMRHQILQRGFQAEPSPENNVCGMISSRSLQGLGIVLKEKRNIGTLAAGALQLLHQSEQLLVAYPILKTTAIERSSGKISIGNEMIKIGTLQQGFKGINTGLCSRSR